MYDAHLGRQQRMDRSTLLSPPVGPPKCLGKGLAFRSRSRPSPAGLYDGCGEALWRSPGGLSARVVGITVRRGQLRRPNSPSGKKDEAWLVENKGAPLRPFPRKVSCGKSADGSSAMRHKGIDSRRFT